MAKQNDSRKWEPKGWLLVIVSFRATRQRLPPVIGAVTQLHAWWHILTGLGSYLHILLRYVYERNEVVWMDDACKYGYNDFFCHSLQIRSTYLKHRPKVKFLCGVWPMLHIESQKASWKGPEKRKMDQSQTSDGKRSSQWASAAAGSDQRLSVWFPCSPSCSVRQVH